MSSREIHILHPKLWFKHFSLLPVVGCVAGACALGTAYLAYMCATKPDLSFRPSRWLDNAPYKSVKPDECRKLMPFSHAIVVDPQLVALRREIGSYKA
jgi:hypothetical protein